MQSVPDWYKSQEMWDKGVEVYLSTIQFVPECYKTEEMSNKAVNIC